MVPRPGSVVAVDTRPVVLGTGRVLDMTRVARGMDFHTLAKALGLSSFHPALAPVHGMAPSYLFGM